MATIMLKPTTPAAIRRVNRVYLNLQRNRTCPIDGQQTAFEPFYPYGNPPGYMAIICPTHGELVTRWENGEEFINKKLAQYLKMVL